MITGAFLLLNFKLFAAEDIRYETGGRRDPFIPLVGPGGVITQTFDPANLRVEGIVFDPNGGSLVLINGEFYKQGETLQDVTVKSIFKDRVILVKDDEEKELWLQEEVVDESKVKIAGGTLPKEPDAKKNSP